MLFLTGILTITSAVLLTPFALVSTDTYALVCTAVMLAALGYTTYLSFKFLRRL